MEGHQEHSHCCTAIASIHLQNFFISPNSNSAPINTASQPTFPHLLATTILLPVPVNLTRAGPSFEWSHTAFVLLWLHCVTQHSVLGSPRLQPVSSLSCACPLLSVHTTASTSWLCCQHGCARVCSGLCVLSWWVCARKWNRWGVYLSEEPARFSSAPAPFTL